MSLLPPHPPQFSHKIIKILLVAMACNAIIFLGLGTFFNRKNLNRFILERDKILAQSLADNLTENYQREAFSPQKSHHHMMRNRRVQPPYVILSPEGILLSTNLSSQSLKPLNKINLKELNKTAEPFFGGKNSIKGYILVGSMIDQIDNSKDLIIKKELFLSILLSTLISTLITLLWALPLLKKSLDPLKTINRGVKKITNQDYTQRITLPKEKNEIYELAKGFNSMAQSLEKNDLWKKKIVSDTAHELRTPVSLILGNLELMIEGIYPNNDKQLKILFEETQNLSHLISELQSLALIDAKQIKVREEKFNTEQSLRSLVKRFSPLILEKKINFTLNLEKSLILYSDKAKFEQVLKNLMSNAIKFTPEGGTISLHSRIEENGAIFEVQDSGPGIPVEEQEKIFSRFYRIEHSRNSHYGGSGLGLSISQGLAQLLNGVLKVSTAPQGGAKFSLQIPQKF